MRIISKTRISNLKSPRSYLPLLQASETIWTFSAENFLVHGVESEDSLEMKLFNEA